MVRIERTDPVMRILFLIHESDVPSGSFSTTARELGQTVDEHSFSLGSPPPSPADTYDAVVIFGGTDNVAERPAKPWMDRELEEISRLITGRTPVLGICLGGQLIAAAAGGSVFPMDHEGVGWQEVELTREAPEDPLVGTLPTRFRAYLWHEYQFSLPENAVPLGRSEDCLKYSGWATTSGLCSSIRRSPLRLQTAGLTGTGRRLELIARSHTLRWRGTSRRGTSSVTFLAGDSSPLPPRIGQSTTSDAVGE